MRKTVIKGNINFNGVIKDGFIVCDGDKGVITDISYGRELPADIIYDEIYAYDDHHCIEVGDLNAHSHPEQSIYTDIVDKSWDLATWCRNTIYKYSTSLQPEHIYFACCRAFSRMLGYGITSVMVSFYCHNNKGNEYDRMVIKAARDVGIRLYFGRMNYDIINTKAYEEKLNSQRSYYEDVNTAEGSFLSLYNEVCDENIIIAPAVHSIHASTKEAIINAINLGNKYNRLIQFHLSEDPGDVDMSLELYGKRPIEFLVALLKAGNIDSLENMLLSDCVWIDDTERSLIKEYNMKVVLNPRMNHRIKTGEAQLDRLISEGIHPYLGTDGEASNDNLSVDGERGFLHKRFPDISVEKINQLGKQPLRFGNSNIGELKVGSYCDLKVVKNNEISDVFVGGKRVLQCGKLLTLDVDNYIEKEIGSLIKRDLT